MCKPTHEDLNIRLKELVNWETFGIQLPGIHQYNIEAIKREHHGIGEQKQALISKWLRVYPNASWNNVVVALESVDENLIANEITNSVGIHLVHDQQHSIPTQERTIKKAVVDELWELHKSFRSLSNQCEIEIKELVKTGKISLNHLVNFAKKEKAYMYNLQVLSQVKTSDQFFDEVGEHYNFIDHFLLVTLAEEYLKSHTIFEEVQKYVECVDEFMNGTEIRDIQSSLHPFFTKSKDEVPVTVRVQDSYGKMKAWEVWVLLENLFIVELTDRQTKFFRIIPSSIAIVFLVAYHISTLLTEEIEYEREFMQLIGVLSLQIGDTCIFQQDKCYNKKYKFDKGLMQAQAVNNIEALKYLLHVPNVKSREDLKKAYEKDIDYRTKAWITWSIEHDDQSEQKSVAIVPFKTTRQPRDCIVTGTLGKNVRRFLGRLE